MYTIITYIQLCPGCHSPYNNARKKFKNVNIVKKKAKLLLFTVNIIVYIETPREFTYFNFDTHWETKKKFQVTHFIGIFTILMWSGREPQYSQGMPICHLNF